jgi:DNA-binding MarR family transcriptional regulator
MQTAGTEEPKNFPKHPGRSFDFQLSRLKFHMERGKVYGMHDQDLNRLLMQAGVEFAKSNNVDDLTSVKLWENPCWFSARVNYLALQFNVPVYRWIEVQFGLQRTEFVILYSLWLKDELTASSIASSSGFPKNTISRSVQKLIDRGIIVRSVDPGDLRSFVLRITEDGRRIVDAAVQPMRDQEDALLAGLSTADKLVLSNLLAKVIATSNHALHLSAGDVVDESST